jgi:hypothetical protein
MPDFWWQVLNDMAACLNCGGCCCCCCCWQVEDDRAQINAVIQQLDEKKREALKETWKQVRQHI